jgi:hypothetical protein
MKLMKLWAAEVGALSSPLISNPFAIRVLASQTDVWVAPISIATPPPLTPSFNRPDAAYLSVDGGATAIAQFNNGPNGDTGDFTISPCLIQSWQVCTGPLDFNGVAYNVGSISYQMEESVGWNPTAAVPGPVVGAGLPGIVLSIGAIGLFGWRRKRKPASSTA